MTKVTEYSGIDIVLATYNGVSFLEEQLRSLLAQDYGSWRLLIRDDGSTDGTADAIKDFAALYPERVRIANDSAGRLGPVGTFSKLLERTTASYVAFCDQDDVWKPDRLSITMARMQELEQRYGRDCPLLVFTDLTVVDESLHELSPSFWKYQGLKPEYSRFLSRLLVQNVVTGSTTLMNRALAQKVTPIPAEAAMHDWWAALVASTFGQIGFIPRPTVLYRQHGQNAIGAKSVGFLGWPRRAYEVLRDWRTARRRLARRFEQARTFLAIHGDNIPEEKKTVLVGVCSLPDLNLLLRIVKAVKLRCLPSSLPLGILVLIWGTKSTKP